MEGQRILLTQERSAEMWQFFAFLFAATLTLTMPPWTNIANIIGSTTKTWPWWRLGIRVGLFFGLGALFMLNWSLQNCLVTMMHWMKRKSALLP